MSSPRAVLRSPQTLHAGPGVLGGYWTLFACGATAGALAASWAQRFGLWRVAVAVMIGWGACLVPFGFTASVAVGFAALAAGGLVYGSFPPLKQTIIQRYSPAGSLAGLATIAAAGFAAALLAIRSARPGPAEFRAAGPTAAPPPAEPPTAPP
jgi:hypothetical protein